VKLKNSKTEKRNSKINENQVNSIIIKSSFKKNIFLDNTRSTKILKNNFKGRKDSRGVPIIMGNRNHKVSFADILYGSNLAIIINIESFKLYNSLELKIPGDNESTFNKKKDLNCRCHII